jgi:hypothetical protein
LIFGERSSIADYFVATFAPGGLTDTLLARALIVKAFFQIRPRLCAFSICHSQLSIRVVEGNDALQVAG